MAKYLRKRKRHYCSFSCYFIPSSLFFFLLASCLTFTHKYLFSLCGQKGKKETSLQKQGEKTGSSFFIGGMSLSEPLANRIFLKLLMYNR